VFYSNVFLNKNDLYHIFYDDNGERQLEIIKNPPYSVYYSDDKLTAKNICFPRTKDSLTRYDFKNFYEYRKVATREDKELKFYDDIGIEYKYIYDNYPDEIKFSFNAFRIFYLDIEVLMPKFDEDNAIYPVTALTNYCSKDDTYYVFYHSKDFSVEDSELEYRNKIKPIKCKDEKDMLQAYLSYWKSSPPDIVTGWNVHFDVKYLIMRCENLGIDSSKFSVAKSVYIKEGKTIDKKTKQLKNVKTAHIKGVSILDYMEMYQKYVANEKSSYSLANISDIELDETKLDYDDVYNNLTELYHGNFQWYVDYNIQDVYLVVKLNEKLNFIGLQIALAYSYYVNIEDVFLSTKSSDVMIGRLLYKNNIAIPPMYKSDRRIGLEGGYVKKPTHLGFCKWVDIFDVASMYPSTMISFEINPFSKITKLDNELLKVKRDILNFFLDYMGNTLRDESYDHKMKELKVLVERFGAPEEWGEKQISVLKNRKVCVTFNGAFFDVSHESLLSTKLKYLFSEKDRLGKVKKDYYKQYLDTGDKTLSELAKTADITRDAKKRQMNSWYGVYGSRGFRYIDEDIVEAVTYNAKYLIAKTAESINKALQAIKQTDTSYILYQDTDSIFIELKELVDKSLTKEQAIEYVMKINSEVIDKVIHEVSGKMTALFNARENFYDMDNEGIAISGLMRSKKKYIMRLVVKEGLILDKYEEKARGVDIRRSIFSDTLKDWLGEFFNSLFEVESEADINELIYTYEKRFLKLTPREVAETKGVHGLNKYYVEDLNFVKGTPYHVKAALSYNYYVNRQEFKGKYDAIKDGDKVKILFLTPRNEYNIERLAFPNNLVPEEMIPLIDYKTQFEKTFFASLNKIFESLDFNITYEKNRSKKLF